MDLDLSFCRLCPRRCGVDRSSSLGFCGASDKIKLARAALHMWEEPCISGKRGTGTVFFSGCSLACVYCQNSKISRENFGKEVSAERLREIFFELIALGAHSIELVTPTHYVPQIINALTPKLPVPVIYNTSGYESTDTLKMLEGQIDIFMPDFKYSISSIAKKYSGAEDYPKVCVDAINEMYRQVGDCEFSQDGLLKKGVLVRHLILPSNLLNTKGVIKSFAQLKGERKILFSLMAQYTPIGSDGLKDFPELTRPILKKELDSAIRYLEKFPQIEGYVQELSSKGKQFIPSFDLTGI